jgi:hypothetical protein
VASVEVKGLPNFKKISKEDFEKREKRLNDFLAVAVKDIVKRTQSGTDANGGSFEKYTPEYAHYKFVKKKRGPGKVDLTFSGAMLRAMTHSVKRLGNALEGIINFTNVKDGEKARGNMQKRNFFNLSDTQIKKLMEIMRNLK